METIADATKWRRNEVAALIIVLLTCLVPLLPSFEHQGLAMDEGMVLAYPEQILKGKLPYRDFETFYTPGNLYSLAGVYAVFGVSVEVERTVGLVYRLILLAGVFAFARRWGLPTAVGSVALAALVIVPTRLYAFAWYGGVVCAFWSVLVLAAKPSGARLVVSGLLAAGALLFRQDLGPAVLASAIPLVLHLTRGQKIRYLASFSIGLLPLCVLLVVVGWRPMLDNLFIMPVLEASKGRHLPLGLAEGDVRACLMFHAMSIGLAMLASGLSWWRTGGSNTSRLLLSVSLLAAGMTHQATQRADIYHVPFGTWLSIALLPVSIVVLSQMGRSTYQSPSRCILASCVAVFAFSVGSPGISRYLGLQVKSSFAAQGVRSVEVIVRDRAFPMRAFPRETQKVAALLEEQSSPGERLFVGTGDLRKSFAADTFFYHLFPWLTPATYFMEFNPLSANRTGSRLADDLATADWVILNRFWDHPNEPNMSNIEGSNAPNEIRKSQFKLVLESGPYGVFKKRSD
jgi:hypothetical protein